MRGQAYDALTFDPLAMVDAPPEGESDKAFRQRVGEALAHLLLFHGAGPGPLPVVTHGLVIREMLRRHARLADGTACPERLRSTSVTQLGHAPPHVVDLMDCVHHFDTEGSGSPDGLGLHEDNRSLSGD